MVEQAPKPKNIEHDGVFSSKTAAAMQTVANQMGISFETRNLEAQYKSICRPRGQILYIPPT